MTLTTGRIREQPAWLGTLFDRIICGVDGTESTNVAVAQAMRLLCARRVLELISVVERRPSGGAGRIDSADLEQQYDEARRALRDARAQCPRARSAILFGDAGPVLVAAAREAGATLVAVGAPPGGRLGGFVLDSAGTYVLHNSPCSVLIARQPAEDDAWPRSIVVGHDGSRGAAEAAVVARELAFRFGAALRFVVATGGDPVDVDSLPSDEELDWSSWQPVNALEAASAECDLLVVGSRGLRGPRALGSVSEAISDLAHSSVLVVREPHQSSQLERGVEDAVPDPEC
jgi:nucleotide-binding universal stress UspA family protein